MGGVFSSSWGHPSCDCEGRLSGLLGLCRSTESRPFCGGWGTVGSAWPGFEKRVGVPETKRTALANLSGQKGSADFLLLWAIEWKGHLPNDLVSIALGMFYGMSDRKIA